MKRPAILVCLVFFSLGFACWNLAVIRAQIAESTEDPTGVSIPYPFVHLVHSRDAAREGTTAHLRAYDPYLLYQLGRDLLNRQFAFRHGVYGRSGELSVPLYVGRADAPVHGGVARFARDHASSCIFCHSTPYREPGGGPNIGSTGGMGRNSVHFYGSGIVEMLGEQVRSLILERYDTNRNRVIDRAEVTGSRPVEIRPSTGAAPVSYGDLSPGEDGIPRLNSVFRIWYLDAAGRLLPDAHTLKDPRVAAFDFAMGVFGWGRGYGTVAGQRIAQGGEAVTMREFYTVAADFHMGMQANDSTQQPMGGPRTVTGLGGLAARSLNGAQQFDFGGSVDRGLQVGKTGLSLDDPDGDGFFHELTEGDVDAVEFYMLHAPAPAVRATARSEDGRRILESLGCVRCHVENWQVLARDDARGLRGDRRLFRLEVRSRLADDGSAELAGALVPLLHRSPRGEYEPSQGSFRVERIYTDFKHWDIGPEFHERRFDGTLQHEHRTAPLWGVGSTPPYGHSGRFLSLEAVILAHGGAAARARRAFRSLSPADRRLLIEYLDSLVLYSTDEIPTDIDGDGVAAERFEVAGHDVGFERFDARFLFRRLPRYQLFREVTNHTGRRVALSLIENVGDAFAMDLAYRRDADGDGFPDVIDSLPQQTGISKEIAPDEKRVRSP